MEDPSVTCRRLDWGVKKTEDVKICPQTILHCIHISGDTFIALSSKNTYRFDSMGIKEKSDTTYSAAVYIKEQNIVVAITTIGAKFCIFLPNDFKSIVADGFPTNQVGVFTIYYSAKSNSLITIGQEIKIWNFSCKQSENRLVSARGEASITLRSTIPILFEVSTINPPCFNYEKEEIYVPRENNICSYNLDGEFVANACKSTPTPRTVVDICYQNNTKFSIDSIEGLMVYDNLGNLQSRTIIGESSVLYAHFIDEEYVLVIDSKFEIFIVDIKIGNLYLCGEVDERPTSVCMHGKGFYCCNTGFISFYRINVNFHLFLKGIPKVHSLKTFSRKDHAQRILVQTTNAYITFINPKKHLKLTTATVDSIAIKDYLYERDKSENIFIADANGVINKLDTLTIPCAPIETSSVGTISYIRMGENLYCLCLSGEIIQLDQTGLMAVKRFVATQGRGNPISATSIGNMIVVFLEFEVVTIDPSNGRIVKFLPMSAPSVYEIVYDKIVLGFKSGKMASIDADLNLIEADPSACHHMEVTGMTFHNNFIATVSIDRTAKIWSTNMDLLMTIETPSELHGICVLDGHRSLVVGAKHELMEIRGSLMFNDSDDPPNDRDNYNQMDDELTEQVIGKRKSHTVEEPTEENENVERRSRRKRRFNKEAWEAMLAERQRRYETAVADAENALNNSNTKNNGKEIDNMTEAEKTMIVAEMAGLEDKRDASLTPKITEASETHTSSKEEENEIDEKTNANNDKAKKPRKNVNRNSKSNSNSKRDSEDDADDENGEKKKRKRKSKRAPRNGSQTANEDSNQNSNDEIQNEIDKDNDKEEGGSQTSSSKQASRPAVKTPMRPPRQQQPADRIRNTPPPSFKTQSKADKDKNREGGVGQGKEIDKDNDNEGKREKGGRVGTIIELDDQMRLGSKTSAKPNQRPSAFGRGDGSKEPTIIEADLSALASSGNNKNISNEREGNGSDNENKGRKRRKGGSPSSGYGRRGHRGKSFENSRLFSPSPRGRANEHNQTNDIVQRASAAVAAQRPMTPRLTHKKIHVKYLKDPPRRSRTPPLRIVNKSHRYGPPAPNIVIDRNALIAHFLNGEVMYLESIQLLMRQEGQTDIFKFLSSGSYPINQASLSYPFVEENRADQRKQNLKSNSSPRVPPRVNLRTKIAAGMDNLSDSREKESVFPISEPTFIPKKPSLSHLPIPPISVPPSDVISSELEKAFNSSSEDEAPEDDQLPSTDPPANPADTMIRQAYLRIMSPRVGSPRPAWFRKKGTQSPRALLSSYKKPTSPRASSVRRSELDPERPPLVILPLLVKQRK